MGFRLRSLMNVRAPMAADETFLAVQDDYLRRELDARGVVRLSDLRPLCGDLYLWQGDITRLQCGAIVNAANAGMTGCYIPRHACIDNCIHTYAGVQLRRDCAEIMAAQGSAEPTGRAKITRAYNLPCDYVLHTVGPIVNGRVTSEAERLLAACYRSCLELAAQHGVQSVAFCCISTGCSSAASRVARRRSITGRLSKTWSLRRAIQLRRMAHLLRLKRPKWPCRQSLFRTARIADGR